MTTFFLLLALAPFHAKADSVTLRYINLHGGVGYGLYRDLGASPLTYRGIELHPGISFQWQNPLWRCEALFLAEGGGYGLKARISYIQAYGGHPVLAFKA
ncbi:MAG: hypothetical protein J5641_04110, partial [Bacteroidales bacterium]|nr:hypothetical protein [Bacteroidales bacterium]